MGTSWVSDRLEAWLLMHVEAIAMQGQPHIRGTLHGSNLTLHQELHVGHASDLTVCHHSQYAAEQPCDPLLMWQPLAI